MERRTCHLEHSFVCSKKRETFVDTRSFVFLSSPPPSVACDHRQCSSHAEIVRTLPPGPISASSVHFFFLSPQLKAREGCHRHIWKICRQKSCDCTK